TFNYLESIPGRDRYLKELESRINYERFTVPFQQGGKTFYSRNSGLQNQDVLYVVDKPGTEPRILIDPNTLSTDGTVALNGMDVSLDGKWLLYALSVAGSDWVEWHIRNVETGKDLTDVIKHSKFGGGVMDATGQNIYYLRYPE